jgi:sensor domain CHASE-containing protein
MFVVEIPLHFPSPQNIMKLFASKFYQTLVLNVATIAAIVVGLVQFAVRAYNENNGEEKTRKVMQTVLQFVNTIITKLQAQLNSNVTVVDVSTTH